jgi:hypothetical protein
MQAFGCAQAASRTAVIEKCIYFQYEQLFGVMFAVVLPVRGKYFTSGAALAKVSHNHHVRAGWSRARGSFRNVAALHYTKSKIWGHGLSVVGDDRFDDSIFVRNHGSLPQVQGP